VSRFRRLKSLPFQYMEACVDACIVACSMHNFCVLEQEEVFDYDAEENEDILENVQIPAPNAKSFRDMIVQELYNSL
jgi:hypothetical protein